MVSDSNPVSEATETVTPKRERRRSADELWKQWTDSSPSSRLRLLVVAILSLGSASLLLRAAALNGSVELSHVAWGEVFVRAAPSAVPSVIEAASAVVLQWPPETPAPAPSPTPAPTLPVFKTYFDRKCYFERDVGIISEILASKHEFCERANDAAVDPADRTHVTFVDLQSSGIDLRSMVFHHDLELDFTHSAINRPIASLAQDGGDHDPRFVWVPSMISCGCREFQKHAADFYRQTYNRTILRPWEPVLANTYMYTEHPSTVCGPRDAGRTFPPEMALAPVREIEDKTVVIARRDDHNPFFQVSNALNAWLMMRALGWKREETRVIHMDGGYPSPIDELHHRLLSSPDKFSLLRGGEDLLGQKFKFTNQVMIAPYETTGPMMQHLNDYEPCKRSQLIAEFRADALKAMQVDEHNLDTSEQITVTIISRRNYGGRKVQRRWINEDTVLEAMRAKYKTHNGVPIVIQSIEFVNITLAEQMKISLNSDVVIGMHGAGMVNVLWTKPETLVVEIFPRRRYRWGYRNLCQYLGCAWNQYRGGRDIGNGDNASDKVIAVSTWMDYFDPLFKDQLRRVAGSKAAGPEMPPEPVPISAPTAEPTVQAAPPDRHREYYKSPFGAVPESG